MSVSLAVGALAVPVAEAAVVSLYDFAFNLNGVLTSAAFPGGVNGAGLNLATGLGSVQVSLSGAGPHYVAMFVDHEIDEAINTFSNEIATPQGTPASGQTWQVDEPGWANGDIYANLTAGALDNAVGVSIFDNTVFPDDVSMALAHGFTLSASESAQLTFTLGLVPPAGGFYLAHTDPDSASSIYFSSTLTIAPEPALAWLPLAGAGVFSICSRRRTRGR
jgi:hypothetical protein